MGKNYTKFWGVFWMIMGVIGILFNLGLVIAHYLFS